MLSHEKVLAALQQSQIMTVSQVVRSTGVSETTVRKTLNQLVSNGQVIRHETAPTSFSVNTVGEMVLDSKVQHHIGNKPRSVDYIARRVKEDKGEVAAALLRLVASGKVVRFAKRFRRAA